MEHYLDLHKIEEKKIAGGATLSLNKLRPKPTDPQLFYFKPDLFTVECVSSPSVVSSPPSALPVLLNNDGQESVGMLGLPLLLDFCVVGGDGCFFLRNCNNKTGDDC